MPNVAVVILNYNGKNYLKMFLPTALTNTPHAEIIVADNASKDGSVSFIEENYPTVTLIKLDKNYGFTGGYNRSLSRVKAKYFVLLNSDVEVTQNWLTPLVDFIEKNDDYAACQPKILNYNRKNYFEYAGAAGGYIDTLGYPFCRGRLFDSVEKDEGQYDSETDIFWTSGACMVVRSAIFWEKGGFDDDFFAHMEEIDFCWRLKNEGWKIRFIPTSTVYHVGGGTLSQSSPFKTHLNFRNAIYTMIKNMTLAELGWKLPVRIVLDWVAMLKFALEGRGRHIAAIFKAHVNVLITLRKTFRKRERPHGRLTKPYSIVLKYFVQGKKKYANL